MARRRPFVNRWGQTTLREAPKYSAAEKLAYVNRLIKRANKAAGYTTGKKPTKWRYDVEGQTGEVEAHTRSEARARIKEQLGIKKKQRLPVGISLEKVDE